jgi:hypothetical protein
MDDLLLNDINLDDVLISILITVVPRRIVLHNIGDAEKSESVKMIRGVFGDRITECKGCERCWGFIKPNNLDKPCSFKPLE